ncbi:MAG TPA: methyltransferase domain-containing protein [Beijerinckiaceae bacterium]|jgi:2-polyprenyl-3-methyl-5-hydroxy-6-metoxy-1,4-benzoquinol methylase
MSGGATPQASGLWRLLALAAHAGDTLGLRRAEAGRAVPAADAPEAVTAVTDRIEEQVWTATALVVAIETGLVEALLRTPRRPLQPAEAEGLSGLPAPIAAGVLDILVGLGWAHRDGEQYRASAGLDGFARPERFAQLAAAVQAPLLQARDFRARAAAGEVDLEGWRFTDPDVIEAQGALTAAMAERAIPRLRFLPGLTSRLEAPGAALLDVGAGAAGLAIALCRRFPHLRAVCLEPAPHPAAIGEAKITEAGLSDRIELRRQRVEHIAEAEAYDLVFLPQMFLPDPVMAAAAPVLQRALKPRGWLLAAVMSRPGADAGSAVLRLRNLLWGGNARSAAAVKDVLLAAGFSPVIRSPGREVVRMVCARRPPS